LKIKDDDYHLFLHVYFIIDGVSLTVNRVEGDTFEVNLIPHTLEVTTLGRLKKGTAVNLEIDLVARYVERILAPR
jgi:riboflavin synthase